MTAWQYWVKSREDGIVTKGLLCAIFDHSAAREDEFNDWYDLEHVPERLRVPGFLNAQRWVGEENPKIAVATYDLASHAVMDSPAYRAIGGDNGSVWTKRVTGIAHRLLRFEGGQLRPGDAEAPQGASGLLVATMNVDPAAEAEFNTWYDTEHLPQLGAVPGVLSARRYQARGTGIEKSYLALYHMTSVAVSRSAAWQSAANTPWTERMRPHFRDPLVLRCVAYSRKD